MSEIVLAGGMRTPFGDFGKSLRNTPMTDLGVHAAGACLSKAGLPAAKVDHLVWGNVLPVDHDGYFASRVIALKVDMPVESCALNVSRACGSGTQAILTAAEQIMAGQGEIALAGGGENFSRGPYALTTARWGAVRGPQQMQDTLDWAYRDPFSSELMGETAENLADDFQYTRDAMDDYALSSQQRVGSAIDSGFLAKQIAPIEVPEGKGVRTMNADEFPRPQITREKLGKLRPVFREGGRVTPGNSSGVTDGAAFVVVGNRDSLEGEGVARPSGRLGHCRCPASHHGLRPRASHRQAPGASRVERRGYRLLRDQRSLRRRQSARRARARHTPRPDEPLRRRHFDRTSAGRDRRAYDAGRAAASGRQRWALRGDFHVHGCRARHGAVGGEHGDLRDRSRR